ncbi:RNA polymerase sigma factor for flagellar operon FliA [Ectothiorhodospira magna]|uniref:RNA polymerase sigma factor FliA n=1 Tax=Ectothiorhodospira magna TaxID=867345 RepID=A0A1H9DYG0_9GAMM|nr:RNA polymerase sigma factor FliA [Ectothiorhodospira magna]SEQ17768.1 RNA polymerase sigma factor for flagellar operon FliA [Ectothiorhodospira magna]
MYSCIEVDHTRLVDEHVPLVKRIAYHLLARLPANVQVEDLIQSGVIGLLEAARHYDPSQGASFETYAGIRIRGAMLDEVRRSDWTPRSVHRNARRISEVIREIENREGREATGPEVAAALNVDLDTYHDMLRDAVGSRVLGFDDLCDADGDVDNFLPGQGPTPLESVTRADFQRALANHIDALPERERLILSLYYDDELNLREIGEVLGVSESRVCQLHGQALVRLRARMTEWVADGERV